MSMRLAHALDAQWEVMIGIYLFTLVSGIDSEDNKSVWSRGIYL